MVLAISLGCDENNNIIAQEPGPMDPWSSSETMTMVAGNIIDPGDQCGGMLNGFKVGDDITIQMNGGNGEDLPQEK